MSPPTGRVAAVFLVMALTVAARLPLVTRGSQFFDSDEAVEGLMARHVSGGELPVFMWGQSYKGVPEVYLAAAVFAVAGAGVVALKATTLAVFVIFVGCQFVLLGRVFGQRVAWLASLFLILGPPVLVYWSLSGSAEIAVTLLAGSVLLLACDSWSETRSPAALAVAGVALGVGLWVQQYIVYYLVALVLTRGWTPPDSRRWRFLNLFLGVAALYALLGAVAFFTAGFDLPLGIGVHHPQKLWRFCALGLAIWLTGSWLLSLSVRERVAAVAGFAIGYAPALAFRVTMGGGLPPLARMDAHGLAAVLRLLTHFAAPMLLGFAGPTGDALPLPRALSGVMIGAMVLSYIAFRWTRKTSIAHAFLVSTPLIVIASGAYADVQSYRYLMPLFAALPVVYATGVNAVWRWHRAAGAALASALLLIGASQQIAWLRTLGPDAQSRAILACLNNRDVPGAYAGYWLSYKLTFLAGERTIVAPTDGLDRYPAYTARVRASGNAPTIVPPPWPHPEAVACERVLLP